MAYTLPQDVLSPREMISDLEVVFDGGENEWSVAKFKWGGAPVVGVRWNGGSGNSMFPDVGNPQSRGYPTWFVLPKPLEHVVLMYGLAHAALKSSLANLAGTTP